MLSAERKRQVAGAAYITVQCFLTGGSQLNKGLKTSSDSLVDSKGKTTILKANN